ncbi:MAG: hypothetical protein PHQ54_04300, partial [Candidatus Omnitrophica bacterium]|nr:hypothetical protein [Candidatus Omnitrophota bacterium]
MLFFYSKPCLAFFFYAKVSPTITDIRRKTGPTVAFAWTIYLFAVPKTTIPLTLIMVFTYTYSILTVLIGRANSTAFPTDRIWT